MTPDEEVVWHQQALDRWYGPYCRKLEPDELEECHRLIDEFVDARNLGCDQHRERLRNRARYLAGEVRGYRLTLADAERRLDALAKKLDPDFPVEHPLVPWSDARGIVRDVMAEVLQ